MPTIFEIFAFKFGFYSNDHLPIHVHVTKGDAEARIILEPEIKLDWNRGFKANEIKKIMTIAETFSEELKVAWIDYFKID